MLHRQSGSRWAMHETPHMRMYNLSSFELHGGSTADSGPACGRASLAEDASQPTQPCSSNRLHLLHALNPALVTYRMDRYMICKFIAPALS